MVALWHQGRLEECADLVHFWHHWTAKGWGILQPVALHGVKCNYNFTRSYRPPPNPIGNHHLFHWYIYIYMYVCMYTHTFIHVIRTILWVSPIFRLTRKKTQQQHPSAIVNNIDSHLYITTVLDTAGFVWNILVPRSPLVNHHPSLILPVIHPSIHIAILLKSSLNHQSPLHFIKSHYIPLHPITSTFIHR